VAFVADDAHEVASTAGDENLRISVCGPVDGKYNGCIDLWNGDKGLVRGLVMTTFVFRSKRQARELMERTLRQLRGEV
jgi:hypothetical protein